MIELEVGGKPYRLFKEASLEIRMDALCRRFSFSATRSLDTPFPLKGGEACRVLVDGNVVLTGYVEKIDVSYSDNEHSIAVQGRDKTADILDSSLGAIGSFSSTPTMRQVVEKVIQHLGLSLRVVDAVGEAHGSISDLPTPEPGQNAFEFLEKIARKRKVLLTSDALGSVVISRATATTSAPSRLQNRMEDDGNNNIISASVSYDLTGRFYTYMVTSSLNPLTAVSGDTSVDKVANQSHTTVDTQVRVGRQLAIAPNSSSTESVNEGRAKWEANIRKARSRVYSAVVQGFGVKDRLWGVNELIQVDDDFVGIHGRMLVNSVSFKEDDRGTTTTLSMVNQNAYTLELEEPKEQEKDSYDFLKSPT